jgi:quercetin dioxygenase-like cupin family protein
MGDGIARAGDFFRQAGEGARLDVLGVAHVQKASSAETGGGFSLWEITVPPGAGAPPHTHRDEDEAFYVLDGELEFVLEGEAPRRFGAGSMIFGARGRRHAFRNPGAEPARALVLVTPGAGLDRMFVELDRLSAASSPPTLDRVAAVTAPYGIALAPPP